MNIVVYIALIAVLAVASIIDVKTRLVPLWVIALCVGIWIWGQSIGALPIDAISGLLAAAVLGGALTAATCIAERRSTEFVLGGGDIKLLACVALFLGLYNVLWCLFGACVLALIWSGITHQHVFAFVPSIAISTTAMLAVVTLA